MTDDRALDLPRPDEWGPRGGIERPTEVVVPADLEDVGTLIEGAGGLMSASNWWIAAMIHAHTEPVGAGARTDLAKNSQVGRCSFREFAERGIKGFKSKDTVQRYWSAWQKAVDDGRAQPAQPGQKVALPSGDFKLPGGNTEDGDEWYTPAWLFDALDLIFDLDVCGPRDPNLSNVPAVERYTEDDDGLAQPWHGLVWCNPPYSKAEPWATRMIGHGNGLLLTHISINAAWAAEVWRSCSGIRLFQAMEFERPDGSMQRPNYWLMLAAFGDRARAALESMQVPPLVAENPRRVPSPMFVASE